MLADFIKLLQFRLLVHAVTLSHSHDLLGHLNRTEPSLMFISNSCDFPTMTRQIGCCEKGQ